jgi:hypothetical protein
VHRIVTPESGVIQSGSRYFSAFMFRPLKVLDITMLTLASVILFFMLDTV